MNQSFVDMNIIEAYKRGDRCGLLFEGQSMWRKVSEQQIQQSMKSTQGSDESCIVDCFLAYVGHMPWNGNLDSWLWGWLVYHQQHHGTGYGTTYRYHFQLIKSLMKQKTLVAEKLVAVKAIAAESNSFGNASLALVYPLYQYAKANMPEYPAREVVLLFTSCTHTHQDVTKAVNLLMDIIDGKPYDPPSEEYLREHRCAEQPTAYNTLLTAMYIAEAGTEEEVIRRGIHVAGDTDSTLAMAMLLWASNVRAQGQGSQFPHEWHDQITREFREQMAAEPGSELGEFMEQSERIKSSLLGFAIGDALGATTEFMSPEEIKGKIGIHRDITGGGWLELEAGGITDDTEMTLCVANSLVACQGFNLKDIADRFVDWYNSDPVDIGSTCRAGIHRYIKSGNLTAPYDDDGAGNGGVMRALPLILLCSSDRDVMLDTVVAQSRLTHNNQESDEGCRCYADLVAAALTGATKEQLRKLADNYSLFAPEKFDGKSGGYIVETLRTVLYYFFATNSFEDCVIATVNNGQDADTTGALAGGLAAAYYGVDEIPSRWTDALDDTVLKELTQLSQDIAELRKTL